MKELREVRANFNETTITVYQAFMPEIALPAAETGKFGSGFKYDRMTWIKPSFLWMMYRSGWASKPGQECILAIEITRTGFEWALSRSALSHYEAKIHNNKEHWKSSLCEPVRIQWDPERDISLNRLSRRSLQVGLSGEAVHLYCNHWIVAISNQTDRAKEIRDLITEGRVDMANKLLPVERRYPVPDEIAVRIGSEADSA
ncbi:DUF4291 domain-containing protein [Nocardia caishijiensis]|nr:DUF4291 domain-containing protein [Nocardia caishijiensis]